MTPAHIIPVLGGFYPGASIALDFTSNRYRTPAGGAGSVAGIPNITITRASAGYAETNEGTLVAFGSGEARRTNKGLLIEEARTNLCLQSQDFATTWSTGGTVTVNATTSPDGTSSADLVTSGGAITLAQNITIASAAVTYSIYCKKSTGATQANAFGIRNTTTATDLIFITLNYDTGAITYTTGASGATATSLGGGWWRVVITASSGLTSGDTVRLYAGFVGGTTTGSAAYFWGAQLEAASTASSYIVTTTASATRAADAISIGSLSLPYPLSLVAMWERSMDTASQQTMAQLDAGTGANRFNLTVSASDLVTALARGGANGGDAAVSGATSVGITYKGAGRALENSFIAARDGTLSTLDSAFDYPATATRMGVGSTDGNNQLNGYLKRVIVYPRALTDAELQAMTR